MVKVKFQKKISTNPTKPFKVLFLNHYIFRKHRHLHHQVWSIIRHITKFNYSLLNQNETKPNHFHFLVFRPLNSASNLLIQNDSLFRIICVPLLKIFSIVVIFKSARECPGPLKCWPITFFSFFFTELTCSDSLSFSFLSVFPI